MKNPFFSYMLIAVLAITMAVAFCACGGSDSSTTSTSTEVVSDYETVVYTFSDNEIEEDLYSSTVTIEYDGDKVMGVTEVMVDDMSAADDDIAKMLMEDYDGALDDLGLKERAGFESEVNVDGKVRTEIKKFDMTKFDPEVYKAFVGIESDKDYVSFEDLTAVYEAGGYTKADTTD